MASSQGGRDFDTLMCDYWRLASLTVMLLDHIFTLDTEVNCLWQRRATRSSYIFFFHRYFNIVATTVTFSTTFIPGLPFSCESLVAFREVMVALVQFEVNCILILRIYALYNCNRRLLSFLISVGTTMLFLSCIVMFSVHNVQSASEGPGACHTQLDRETAIRQSFTWVMVFTYDVLIFGLALVNAIKTRRELQILRNHVSLKVILLRDGAIYFAIMSVVNLANILAYYLNNGCMRGGLAPFASSLSVTLVSRLMLNLHEGIGAGIYASSCASHIEFNASAAEEETSNNILPR